MIKACVIGYPIKHSRSPLIHNHWLKELGIRGSYERCEVAPDALEDFLTTLPAQGLAGCNVTLPHKEAACRYIAHLDDRARLTGSVNTVYLRQGETCATSTDGEGFAENILWRRPGYRIEGITATVLGAGGSSRAIIDELLRRGVRQVYLANRTLEKADVIGKLFGRDVIPLPLADLERCLPETNLLVNTTSAGIANEASLNVPFARLSENAVVSDINYVPLVTPFLRDAQAFGFPVVTGLGMLLHQAVTGFSLWFGQRPKVTEDLYTIIARDIDPGYQP